MKKIFSNLLLLFTYPLRIFSKVFKNNFTSGLILGAIFSLIVNIVSMQIQGLVDKQRVLEALENEIWTNNSQAVNNTNEALTQRKNKLNANSLTFARKFSKDLWEQSIEPLQYVAQLKSDIQIEFNVYYTIAVPSANQLIDILNSQHIDSMKDCFDYTKKLTSNEQNLCNEKYYFYLDNIALYPSKFVYDQGEKILKIFHPTEDRLKNPILRLLMGSESLRVLSGN